MLNTIKIQTVLLVFAVLMPFGSTLSYAWEHGYQGHSGGHSYHGWAGHGRSYIGFGFNYAPYNYCYNLSYYYPYCYDTGGVLVSSPIIETPEVVEQPSPTVVITVPTYPTPEITPAQTTVDTDDITINIPNATGGYTSVSLKRSGKGFIGPQGEYYPEFPRVSVLKVMYGK